MLTSEHDALGGQHRPVAQANLAVRRGDRAGWKEFRTEAFRLIEKIARSRRRIDYAVGGDQQTAGEVAAQIRLGVG
jgi:hypothetical protein